MEKCESKYCGCLFYSANAFARVMTKIAEEEFAVTGLAPSYAFLYMSVKAKPGINPKELSEKLQLTQSTVTRLIEKMEHRGFLVRKSIGKFTEVYPTKNGETLELQIKEAWKRLNRRYSAILGENKAANLAEMISAATAKLDYSSR